MDNRKWLAYVSSAALHSALILCLFLSKNLPVSKVTQPPDPPLLWLEPVQSNEKKIKSLKKKSTTKTKQRASRSSVRTGAKGFNYQSFSPSMMPTGTFSEHQQSQNSGHAEWSDNPVMATLETMDLSEYSENHYFFQILAGKINAHVHYPQDYALHKLVGQVWIQILVDRQGKLLRIINFSKKVPILSTYVLVNLYQILKDPLPERYWYSQEKELAFQLNFEFSVTSVDQVPTLSTVSYIKNRMDFQRRARIPNLIEELTTDYARYFPPIAPTPLGPIINFPQVYNMIMAWREMDPIERKRQKFEMTKEKLDRMLQLEESKHHP